jgi:hypothetical protein
MLVTEQGLGDQALPSFFTCAPSSIHLSLYLCPVCRAPDAVADLSLVPLVIDANDSLRREAGCDSDRLLVVRPHQYFLCTSYRTVSAGVVQTALSSAVAFKSYNLQEQFLASPMYRSEK